ncbi:MAG: polysaccharide deacetylase family protein [Bacteroidales bacterium]|nr:polysaccharide deacetylase family protein [Bacteroidales bacterium]
MDMLILVSKTTNRLHYIFDLIFKDLLGISFKLTTDNETFTSYNGPKFHYGNNQFWNEPFQKATTLLFEHDITEKELKIVDYKDTKAIFPVYNDKSIFPFDIFAASFYLVSRYEEYLPHINDKYNRFQAKDSILFKMNMLDKPLVNIWAIELGNILKAIYPEIQLKKKSFTFIPTYDVDAAWAYKNKGIFRTLASSARDILNVDFNEFKTRKNVILGRQKDPFDTFDYQLQLQKELNLHPLYFILCGEYDLNDKNISLRNDNFQNLIKRLGDYAKVGIHPSFSSYLNKEKVKMEVTNLSKVLNREITISRQHFLRLRMPLSYQILIDLDITDDYTMGYATLTGFRAGIADTFHFFDLEHDNVTNLNIHPFAVMDGTLRDYLDLNVDESYEKTVKLIQEVKNVNGTFILLWHNETLSDEKRWKGWVALYRRILDYALN